MKKIKDFENMELDDKIKETVEILKNGGVAVFPTDTVYGIGTLPKREYVEKIYKIKRRDFSKKIIALISDKRKLSEIIDETPENMQKIRNILNKYWPGELTVIFRADKNFTKNFDKNMETAGVRIPKNQIALEIIKNAGGILLTTSANISGESAVTKIENLNEELLKNVDVAVSGGKTELTGKPSTIVEYKDGRLTLLREGNILFEDILNDFI